MVYDPAEFGQPEEETSEPLDVSSIMSLAAQGQQIQMAARQQAMQPQRAGYPQKQPVRQPLPVHSPMDEIEWKLNVASYYRALLQQPLFGETDDISSVVEKEVRQFILNRLGELLGSNKPKPEPKLPFTETEINALRVLANTILQKDSSLGQAPSQPASLAAPANEPQVRPARRPRAKPVEATEPPPEASGPQVTPVVAPRKARSVVPSPPEEAPTTSVQPSPVSSEPPLLPVPMPRGSAMTAVTASQAMAEASQLEQTFQKTVTGR